MNINEFKQYIQDNFDISGEAHRLINNILCFVQENYTDENDQYNALCSLLDGTIGLTDRSGVRKNEDYMKNYFVDQQESCKPGNEFK